MSKRMNQELSFWTDVLTSLRRTSMYRGSIKLTKRDNETVCQVLVLNAIILKDTAREASQRSQSNLARWCYTTHQLDVKDFDAMQKRILTFLRNYQGGETYDSFKRCLSAWGPSLLGALVAPVRDYLEEFLEVPSSSCFRVLNQFFSFCGRTSLMDVDFTEQMLADYYANEERIRSLVLPEDVLVSMNKIMRKWMSGFALGALNPKHGPGSTAELPRTTHHKKFAELRLDARLQYLMKGTDPLMTYPVPTSGMLERTAKVVFVRKSLSTMRTICKEPASLMYFQQACWEQIEKYVSSHPFLGQRIKFADQAVNRELAREGSRTGGLSTIDLSAASDSVSWELVKRVFEGTEYYKSCLLTRSSKIRLPDGQVITPGKFAPMGSALCFPTECLIFLAACEHVAQSQGVRTPMSFSVYGDDMIILSELTEPLIELLNQIGFLVNQEKSFSSGGFRESCGGEFFFGDDVTPLRIPRNFEGRALSSHTPGLFRLHIDMCNSMWERKMQCARAFLIRKFSTLPKKLQPVFDDGTRGIASSQPTNFHLLSCENKRFHAWYFYAGDVTTRPSPHRVDDEVSLFIWHQRAQKRKIQDGKFPDPDQCVFVQTELPTVSLSTARILDIKRSESLADSRMNRDSEEIEPEILGDISLPS